MQPFGKSQSVTRREDVRFLTGAGQYTGDTVPEGALVAGFIRSDVAHGRIVSVDLDAALDMPGVVLAMGAAEAEAAGASLGMAFVQVPNRDGTKGAAPERPFLARDRVRFVGEPIAVIVGESAAQVRDAIEAVMVEIDDLPVKMDLAPGGETLHAEAPDNVCFDYGLGDEAATARALDASAHRVSLVVEDNRIVSNPMETRACWAEMEGDRLHVCYGGQGVWNLKKELVNRLGLDAERIHVTTPDVGGGFGTKTMNYPEYFCVALATMQLNRPVAWQAERGEGMMTDNAGRDLVSTVEMGFDADHRITAYRVETLSNLGAYNSNFGQLMQSHLFARVLTGTYDIQTAWLHALGIYTNTTQVDAYRGAGRPEAMFALERLMDRAARELGVDPWDLRRRNFIPEGVFPYKTVSGESYDVGAFGRVLSRIESTADRAGFEARRAESAKKGKLRGMGLCYYIESILGDPSEGVTVEFTEDGGVDLYVGTQSNGQGHETVFAQFLSDQTGIPVDRITIIQGDSDRIETGGGTGGSRSVTVQNTVTLKVATEAIGALAAFLEEEEGAEVTFDDERFRIAGSNDTPDVLDVVARARAAGRMELTRFEGRDTLPGRSFPNGAHVAEVEVDPDTGEVTVARYTVVDDFGNLINPLLAEGQVHGGVAQGIGQILMEHGIYDADGQFLTASFMDYAMPRAIDLPMIGFTTEPVPSTANPLGMKGCGEAGTVGAMAALANAVEDATWDRGVRDLHPPLSPARVWAALQGADARPLAAE
ncbi:Carbon monoxide dehydrogenase large chain [Rhodobacteraceae bacterium THAF1]|uniref:xanthine dehydrogenase family protein molybdopterin-binding subunit n=1 Tax=Palleronia sp. THAF1 TaxID=2587842 RepID=UPI000F3DEC5A|nr:xanthine dehydrogenase family protein molybdopterin-binding subunit [Palleronia sp. THAF1]QFU09040.1 Carbon monoxide dehydrogenase large chain [Palleronia sp. THAF1]VDC24182.1 Carbon monoxide dehydrogenase large chain [Rhodobacteraceae bacterium THAF1]